MAFYMLHKLVGIYIQNINLKRQNKIIIKNYNIRIGKDRQNNNIRVDLLFH